MAKFIVIEGIDGCGGNTQTNLLKKYFGKENVLFLSFPAYNTKIGKLIDDFLHKRIVLNSDVELLLYFGDILQFKSSILKARKKGEIILCDRYFTSTIVHQGEKALELNSIFNLPKPDVCFLLDVTGEESQKRKTKEKGTFNSDRNETNLFFLNDTREKYLKVAKNQVFCKWEIINGEKPINEIFEIIKSKLK